MTVADVIQIAILLVMLAGVLLAYVQLTKIARSITLARQGNTVNTVAHCASRYESVISTIPSGDDEIKNKQWWYRYWDLFTEEFNFFRKGLLDPDIFELWLNELATVYNNAPQGNKKLGSRAQSHENYLRSTLPSYKALHDFCRELQRIAQDTSAGTRANMVHALVIEFAPTNSPFEIT